VRAVVAIPAIRLTTSEARRAKPKAIPIPDAVSTIGALTQLMQGLAAAERAARAAVGRPLQRL